MGPKKTGPKKRGPKNGPPKNWSPQNGCPKKWGPIYIQNRTKWIKIKVKHDGKQANKKIKSSFRGFGRFRAERTPGVAYNPGVSVSNAAISCRLVQSSRFLSRKRFIYLTFRPIPSSSFSVCIFSLRTYIELTGLFRLAIYSLHNNTNEQNHKKKTEISLLLFAYNYFLTIFFARARSTT